MPTTLDVQDDFDIWDNTVSATYTVIGADGSAGTSATVTALREGLHDQPGGFQMGLQPGRTTWHVRADELSGITPGLGDQLAVTSGRFAGTYVVQTAALEAWETRWVLSCQKLEGNG